MPAIMGPKKVTINTTDKPIGTKRNKFNNFNQREYDYDVPSGHSLA